MKRILLIIMKKWFSNTVSNIRVLLRLHLLTFGPCHEIFNNVVCVTSKDSDQPAHTRSLITAFACRLNIQCVLSYLEFLSLNRGCTGSSESTLVKMPHCWKSHVTAQETLS